MYTSTGKWNELFTEDRNHRWLQLLFWYWTVIANRFHVMKNIKHSNNKQLYYAALYYSIGSNYMHSADNTHKQAHRTRFVCVGIQKQFKLNINTAGKRHEATTHVPNEFRVCMVRMVFWKNVSWITGTAHNYNKPWRGETIIFIIAFLVPIYTIATWTYILILI